MKATSAISGALLDAVTSDAGTELDMVRSLCDASEAELAARLRDGEIVERVVQLLHPELQKLRTMQAATGAELHSKFAHEVAESGKGFTLKYADLSTFYGGLEAKIGTPSPNFAPAMANEHTKSADSQDSFSTSNYGVTTTPEIEWFFVTDADTLAELPPTERDRRCPKETTNVKDEARRRQPMRLQHLRWKVAEKNTQLAKAHEPVLMLEEAFAGRLYTGPMFVKYNDLLRGFGPALEGCLGNTYVTTTHAINSCIIKIGKLTAACKVYRGVSGGVLPDSFLVPNHFNVRGGIESAFMSTTKDPEVAKHYLRPGAPATIFEMQMGMVDRGADLSWLSQYPHEREILFAPLTGLEVQSTRVEGTVLIVSARLSVNLNAQTMEQVVAKRRKLITDMAEGVELELRNGIANTHPGTQCAVSGMRPIKGLRYQHVDRKDVSICEAEYRQLPTKRVATGYQKDGYQKDDFHGPIEPPIDAAAAARRAALCRAALHTEFIDPMASTWFNEDTHFSQGVAVVLMVKGQLAKARPPMLRLLECVETADAAALPAGVTPLEATQAVAVDSNGGLQAQSLVVIGADSAAAYGVDPVLHMIKHLTDSNVVALRAHADRKSLPAAVDLLENLRAVDLSGCSGIESLPSSLCELTKLVRLELRGCTSLTTLPELAGQWWALEVLDIRGCSRLTRLPANMGQMEQLTALVLADSAIVELPVEAARWKNLRLLDCSRCAQLAALEVGIIEQLTNLQVLSLVSCSSLKAHLSQLYARVGTTTAGASEQPTQLKMLHQLQTIIATWSSLTLKYATTSKGSAGEQMMLTQPDDVYEHLEEHEEQLRTLEHNLSQGILLDAAPIFGPIIREWKGNLATVRAVLDVWLNVQLLWPQVGLLVKDDIRAQLPQEAKRRDDVDATFRAQMADLSNISDPLEACTAEGRLEAWQACLADLEALVKSLDKFLSMKRLRFPRFFFVSDATLLEAYNQGGGGGAAGLERMQVHLESFFDSIKRLECSADDGALIEGLRSADGQTMKLINPVKVEGMVDDWLCVLLNEMRSTVNRIISHAAADVHAIGTVEFIHKYPAQVSVIGIQMKWTADSEEALRRAKTERDAMGETSMKHQQLLTDLATVNLRPDDELHTHGKWTRQKVETMILIMSRQRDVFADLAERGVHDPESFEWQKQMRFYWLQDQDSAQVSIADVDFQYANEYLGVKGRLVITPRTDHSFVVFSQALSMCLGGAAAGGAGTGKTETIKDMGVTLGKFVLVTNCSDQMDDRSLSGIFKGAAVAGLWSILDEVNRIDLEVLAVATQQLASVLTACKANAESFQYTDGEVINLDKRVGYFASYNPGLAVRQELPASLQALFRNVVMSVPDRELIMNVKLAGAGYLHSAVLAKKLALVYALCNQQLSKQAHYDFGLRNILAVLRTCGSSKRDAGSDPTGALEPMLVVRTLRDINLSRFVAEDVPIFLALLDDVFPGVGTATAADPGVKAATSMGEAEPQPAEEAEDKKEAEEADQKPVVQHPLVEGAVRKAILDSRLQLHGKWQKKIIQVYEMCLVRHSLMLVGPSGTGKSQMTKVLHTALQSVVVPPTAVVPPMVGQPHKCVTLNPKSITSPQMFGTMDKKGGEWTDGIFSQLWRRANKDKKNFTWLVLDGPVDAIWIENMNTVMDDNRILTLANNDRIPMLRPNMTLHFEVEDLRNASPATVSRAGIIYVSEADLGWKPYMTSWLASRIKDGKDLEPHFDKLCASLMNFIHLETKSKMSMSEVQYCTSCTNLVDALLADLTDPPDAAAFERFVIYAMLWSMAGVLESVDRAKVDNYLRTITNNLPECELPDTVFEFKIDTSDPSYPWTSWGSLIPSWSFDKGAAALAKEFASLLIPTIDSVRCEYTILLSVSRERGVILVGGPGTAKTSIILSVLNAANPLTHTFKKLSFSQATTPSIYQRQIESAVEKRQGKTFGPPKNKKMYCFVDDISMPLINQWGDQITLEIIRQMVEEAGFYNLDKPGEFKYIGDVLILGAMLHPGAGKNDIPNRAKRHFHVMNVTLPSTASIYQIFGAMCETFFSSSPHAEVKLLAKELITITIHLWETIKERMLPTPVKFHYLFNLRDLSRIFQGIFAVDVTADLSSFTLLALWKHECMRVFSDRLVSHDDKAWFAPQIFNVLESEAAWSMGPKFKPEVAKLKSPPSVAFVTFMTGEDSGLDALRRAYEPITADDFDRCKQRAMAFLGMHNRQFPSHSMNLVLFDDALEHLLRITRVFGLSRGCALLIGVFGSGKQSLTRLAAFISDANFFKLQLTSAHRLLEDLKPLYRLAGVQAKPVVVLLTDNQIKDESLLEYVNMFLNTGELLNPTDKANNFGHFKFKERDAIMSDFRDGEASAAQAAHFGREPTDDELWAFFIERVRSNFHLSLCFSPVGSTLSTRAQQFPGLINGTTIDWFLAWPEEALIDVAAAFLGSSDLHLEVGEDVRDRLVRHMAAVHTSMHAASAEYFERSRRRTYVMTKSFLDTIAEFKTVYARKLDDMTTFAQRVEVGLVKMCGAAADVKKIKVEVRKKVETVVVAQEKTAAMVQAVQEKSAVAEKKRAAVRANTDKVNAEKVAVGQMKDAVEKDLLAAKPALHNSTLTAEEREAINMVIQPKIDSLKVADAKVEAANAKLALAQVELNKVEQITAEAQRQLDETMANSKALQDDADRCQKKMDAANRLLDGLAGQQKNWEAQLDSFKAESGCLVGDTALACAFISYVGPYDAEFRKKLMSQLLRADCEAKQLPFTEGLSVSRFFVDEVTIGDWTREGLHSDQAIENAIMVTRSKKWPLMIDPQSQGLRWIQQREARNKVQTTQLTSRGFRGQLEGAMAAGTSLIIENLVHDTFDPELQPLLNKEIVHNAGRRLTIQLFNQSMEYSDGFSLYLCTKMANAHYAPEVAAVLAVVDFTVTMGGLELQLLSRIVEMRQPGLEKKQKALVDSKLDSKKLLKRTEDDVLYRLANSEGNLLDDGELVEVLQQGVKITVQQDAILADAENTERTLRTVQEEFRPSARRGALLYFLVVDMAAIEHVYLVSLQQFHALHDLAVIGSETTQAILGSMTMRVTRYMQRQLFERHKKLWTLMLAMKIEQDAGKLSAAYVGNLLKGGGALDAKIEQAAPAAWLPEAAWLNVLALSRTVPSLKDLPEELTVHNAPWKGWYSHDAPESTRFPRDEYEQTLGAFERLLLVRAIREDRTLPAADAYIEHTLGRDYTRPAPLSLGALHDEASCFVPMLTLFPAGGEARIVVDLFDLVKEHGRTLLTVSMGQGQAVAARKLLERGITEGHWVLLQNCHLGLSFLSELEEWVLALPTLAKTSTDAVRPSFRMWLTTEPHPKFAVGLLQLCIKFSHEPPAGVVAGLKNSYHELSEDALEAVADPRWKPILYALCFLHTVAQERRKFGPLGFTKAYSFAQADLSACVSCVQNHLRTMEARSRPIDWTTVHYMVCEVLYGGKITDEYDQRLFNTYGAAWLSEACLAPGFQFGGTLTQAYPMPPAQSGDLAGYRAFVETLPLVDDPEVFGLHTNADLAYRTMQTKQMLSMILDIQPKEGGGGGGGGGSLTAAEETVLRMVDDLQGKMPSSDVFGREKVHAAIGSPLLGGHGKPLNTCLLQETERLQRVLALLTKTLGNLKMAIAGAIVMSSMAEGVFDALFMARVPLPWVTESQLQSTTVGLWFDNISKRAVQLTSWLRSGRPLTYLLPCFFNPSAFLLSSRQEVCRAHAQDGWALDDCVSTFEVLNVDREGVTSAPPEGVLICGLLLEGARWDRSRSALSDMEPKVLFSPLPVLHISAIAEEQKQRAATSLTGVYVYQCPLYKTPRRAGEFVSTVELRCLEPPSKWILRGLCLLMTID